MNTSELPFVINFTLLLQMFKIKSHELQYFFSIKPNNKLFFIFSFFFWKIMIESEALVPRSPDKGVGGSAICLRCCRGFSLLLPSPLNASQSRWLKPTLLTLMSDEKSLQAFWNNQYLTCILSMDIVEHRLALKEIINEVKATGTSFWF